MKPRHAAASALVLLTGCGTGLPVIAPELPEWEIMQPPQIEGRPYPTPDETAPLSKWVVAAADTHNYPTQNECEQSLKSLRERARACPTSSPQFSKVCERFSNLRDESRCVSIDDPNLKSNWATSRRLAGLARHRLRCYKHSSVLSRSRATGDGV